jgi:DNA-binding transcriptional LysR family regulator
MGDAIQRIETAIESFRRDRNQVRPSTLATFATCWLLPRPPHLQAQHPHVLSTSIQAVDLSTEGFDCAIRHA